MRLTQHIGLGHLDVVEKQLCRILRLQPQLLQIPTALKPLPIGLNQKQCHCVGIIVWISLSCHDHKVTVNAVRNVGFLTIEHPMIVLLDRMRSHAR